LAATSAIAFLGDTLVGLLTNGLPGITVLLSTPDEFKDIASKQPAVSIFLYQVTINAESRNLPPRSGISGSTQHPPLPLDLRFLVTPWTKDTRDTYALVGSIVRLFYDNAVLGFSDLQGGSVWDPDDSVEIVLESTPVEQLYDIWEPTEVPYRLSLVYLARVIAIDSAVSSEGPPVAVATFPKVGP
jgi:hypothetical protein